MQPAPDLWYVTFADGSDLAGTYLALDGPRDVAEHEAVRRFGTGFADLTDDPAAVDGLTDLSTITEGPLSGRATGATGIEALSNLAARYGTHKAHDA